ncbi:family 78 glycoside hydrolase catalytic domain [Niabella insulamsoli]|uniref:family 78 glycoside hydrolase catalytic domain n=1 Tax=Niabella insulamsoli TaxID=3144874 RepID=UPI0031FD9601
MKQFILILAVLIGGAFGVEAQVLRIVNARCDYLAQPSGVDHQNPSLSWEIQAFEKNIRQTAFRVLVADDSLLLAEDKANVWDSKQINSGENNQVRYGGPALKSTQKYYWKVKVWDNKGNESAYSKIANWRMGLLRVADWKEAKWIAYDVLPDSNRYVPLMHGNGKKAWGKRPDVLPLFRKDIPVKKEVTAATIFISGLGHFELSINGAKVGDHFLDPGWTQYSKQAQYVTFDITDQLRQGTNALGVMLGNGFYYIPGERYRKLTGAYGYPKMMARILIEYADGSEENIVSNASWKTVPSPVYFSSIYGGEDYDANRERRGWNKMGYNDDAWKPAVETNGPSLLQAQMAAPLKVMERFEPVRKTRLSNGTWVYDLGQNFSGIPSIALLGKKGDTVRIIPSELINEDSSANQKGSGGLHAYTYILKGDGVEKWQPRFTYYGFRYLQVEGAVPESEKAKSSLPVIKSIKGLHIRNAAVATGSFKNSNELFNKTNQLIQWAIKSNMVSVFTDCPHREKLGWLEQTHLMGSSVQYNFDVAALNRKMIKDMQQAQYADGRIPEIAPEFTHFEAPFDESPEWGSAAVILPWYNYRWYGDKQSLVEAYDMMKGYVSYLEKKAANHILSHGLGDWYDIGPNRPGVAQLTPLGVTATAIYFYDISIMEKVARLLKKDADARFYKTLGAAVKKAFNDQFFNAATKQYATGSQTSNAIALYTGVVEEQYRDDVLNNLIADIRQRNNALTAGDIGYRYVLRVLEQAGRSDVIYDMNNRSDAPGYGYQIAHGATALTESWQAYPSVSNNHFMLGHLMEWFYSGLCGIGQAANSVAFRQLEIRPQPVGDITSAKANYKSVNGLISVSWTKVKGVFDLKVSIPPNTSATVYFPAEYKKEPVKIGSGAYNFSLK